jgi:hypothetical protein
VWRFIDYATALIEVRHELLVAAGVGWGEVTNPNITRTPTPANPNTPEPKTLRSLAESTLCPFIRRPIRLRGARSRVRPESDAPSNGVARCRARLSQHDWGNGTLRQGSAVRTHL